MLSIKVPSKPTFSPLRYPGGKSILYPHLRALIRQNGLSDGTYVEPYAGGAGAALALLITGEISRVVINDLDPAIYSFWLLATKYSDELSARIAAASLTMEEWDQQRRIYKRCDAQDPISLGYAAFYLNRTNRSGVMNAGAIGGKSQTGTYRLDARFNKKSLIERVRLIELYADRIEVLNRDGKDLIGDFAASHNTLVYADPPYFDKGSTLYLNSFGSEDHIDLANCLNGLHDAKWMLTYDDVPVIHDLYKERRQSVLPINYSAHRPRKTNEVIVYSDALVLPEHSPHNI